MVVRNRPGATTGPDVLRPARGACHGFELVEYFLGPQPDARDKRHPDVERAQAEAAGVQIVDLRMERLRMEFFDIGAVVYFLRKVIWTVPDFTVEGYRGHLRQLHQQIQTDGVFVAHSTRLLIEGRKVSA